MTAGASSVSTPLSRPSFASLGIGSAHRYRSASHDFPQCLVTSIVARHCATHARREGTTRSTKMKTIHDVLPRGHSVGVPIPKALQHTKSARSHPVPWRHLRETLPHKWL